jgi:DNA polymerase III delta subunit
MRTTTAKLFDELRRKVVHPVYLLLGEDRGAKDEFIDSLRFALFEEEPGDVTVFYGDEAGVGAVLEAVSTYSFLSNRKLVVVKDFDKLGGGKTIAEAVREIPDGATLLLLSDKKNADKIVETEVEKKGRSCIFWTMFESDGEKWVAARLAKSGIRADHEALRFVLDATGTATSDLSGQIETVTSFLGEGETLTLEKAKSIVSRIYTHTVFDLTNAIFVKTSRDILRIFRSLVQGGEDLLKIEYFLGREMRKILDICALRESGYEFGRIAELLGLKKRDANRLRVVSESVTVPFLRGLYSGIASLDLTIKSSPRELCILAFERLLVGLGRK